MHHLRARPACDRCSSSLRPCTSVPIGYLTAHELLREVVRQRWGRSWGENLRRERNTNETISIRECATENSIRLSIEQSFFELHAQSEFEIYVNEPLSGQLSRLPRDDADLGATSPLLLLTGCLQIPSDSISRQHHGQLALVDKHVAKLVLANLEAPSNEVSADVSAVSAAVRPAAASPLPKKPRKIQSQLTPEIRQELDKRWDEYSHLHVTKPDRKVVAKWIREIEPGIKEARSRAQEYIDGRSDKQRRGRPKIVKR